MSGMSDADLALVVAVANNRVIGAEGGLPWRIRADLKRFRAITMGKPMVMGRATFDSIGRVLDGRDSIVLTRQRDWGEAGVIVARDLPAALAIAADRARERSVSEICVIGGWQVFAETFPIASRLHVTHVEGSPPGDVFFPEFATAAWTEVAREVLPESEGDTARGVYVVYERR